MICKHICRHGLSVVLILFALGAVHASDWPPALDTHNAVIRSTDGRLIEHYVHGPRQEWGYPATADAEWAYPKAQETGAKEQNHNSFYVVSPLRPKEGAPLYVVLHSANRTAFDYLGYAVLGRKVDNADDPATAMTNVPGEFYGLYLNSTNSEWWGWTQAHQNELHRISAAPPAERRVLDTIEWVVQHYHVDRNRIYLSGVSMGGNGALGIGMHHGDIFAAVRVTVPAGTNFASYSMGSFAPSPDIESTDSERAAWKLHVAARSFPDPPVIVDFSSQTDGWAMTQPALLNAARSGHLPLVLAWGPFGHTAFGSAIAKSPVCQVAIQFPWLEIRKNEAYPVFTKASSDQPSPWLNAPADFDNAGQMNAYFRWKNLEDTPQRFSMELWLAHPKIDGTDVAMPEKAVAEVAIRRLQQFHPVPGRRYLWKITQTGKQLDSGSMKPDAANLLVLPHLAITTSPLILSIRPNEQQ